MNLSMENVRYARTTVCSVLVVFVLLAHTGLGPIVLLTIWLFARFVEGTVLNALGLTLK
jgi:hypothetical protein